MERDKPFRLKRFGAEQCHEQQADRSTCEHWLRGRNGTKCNARRTAHGATQLRRPEAKNAHPEDTELRKAVNGEAPAPAKLLQWREQLAALPRGRQLSFEGLRPTERYALHQLANEFQLTHMSTGVGDQRRLHILRPAPQESSQASQETSSGRLSRAEQKRRKKERLRSQPSKQSTPGDLQTSTGMENGMEGESDGVEEEMLRMQELQLR